jgi:shikimate dehydrogenase
MKTFGLIGKSLQHSFSKQFFTEKFQREQIEATYENFELPSIEGFENLVNEIKISGLNVTIPYKEAIIPFLDELTQEAREIGAVNTIIFKDDKYIGANTDAFGFHQMIKPFLLNTHQKALILGNGGASKSVRYVLKKIGLDVLIAARNPKEGEFCLEDVNELMIKHCGIVINCTPVGTFPNVNDCLNLPFEAFTSSHLAVDLIYNPKETSFLKQAAKYGAVVLNGETMLREQALKSWQLWNE